MHDIATLTAAVTHQLYGALRSPIQREGAGHGDVDLEVRDRGAVSLEQVLWFVAAGVSVAVIAAILWSTIRTEAERPVDVPTAP